MSFPSLNIMSLALLLSASILAGCTEPEPIVAKEEPAAPIQQPPKDFNPNRRYQLKELKKAKIKIAGKHEFEVWVVDTELKRQEGMMFLTAADFSEKQGMLFVFKYEQPLRFWMKNTLVDLDIAYIGANKTINSMYTMKSLDTISDYSSRRNSMFALEVKDGLFRRLGIKVGDKVEIPAEIRSEE